MASIDVTRQTTLQELQNFAAQAGDQAKIRATKNDDGSFTLYASTKKSGIKNFLSGERAELRRAAKDAITMVLSSVRGSNLDNAMANVLSGLPTNKHELRGAALGNLLGQAQSAREQATQAPRLMSELAPSLKTALETAAEGGGNPDQLTHLTTELGNKIAEAIRSKPRETQLDFVMSRGEGAKNDILDGLQDEVNPPGILKGTYQTADPAVKALLDKVYDHAMLNLSDRRVDDNTVMINGTTYTKDKHLADGGYGSVDLYKAPSGEQIVLKTPILKTGEKVGDKFDEAVTELTAHRSAVIGDPTNVAGLKGAVRTPDGMLQIALEYAPGGDAEDLMTKLHDSVGKGAMTPQDANLVRLTMLQDMVKGLKHVQDTRGMVHLDIKAPNFLVDGNGVLKLSDFGTATQGSVRQMRGSPIANPRWASPELLKGNDDFEKAVTRVTAGTKSAKKAAVDSIDKNLSPDQRKIARQNINRQYDMRIGQLQSTVPSFSVTSKTDTWSLGVDAYRLFFKDDPFRDPQGFNAETEKLITDFASNPNNRVPMPDMSQLGLTDQQQQDLQNLIQGLMHPDPAQRPSLDSVLASPLFQQQGVGGPQARTLIQQLAA